MSWRKTVEQRERRREREDRDLPPSMRQGSPLCATRPLFAICAVVLYFLGWFLVSAWQRGEFTTFWMIVGLLAGAALIAWRVAAAFRQKNALAMRREAR